MFYEVEKNEGKAFVRHTRCVLVNNSRVDYTIFVSVC